MRFHRAPRVTAYEPTNRKKLAVVRRQRLDREKFPLFAAEIAEGQDEPEQVLADRAVSWVERQHDRRADRAASWWRARAALAAIEEPARTALLAHWNGQRWLPGDPERLASEVHSYRRGDLVMHEGRIVSAHELQWQRERDAKIAALSDVDLDRMIQTHVSPMFVDLGRAERQRRAEAATAEAPAPRPARHAGRRR